MTTTVKYVSNVVSDKRCAVCQRASCVEDGFWIITVDGVVKFVGSDCFSAVVQPTCPKCNSTHVILAGFNNSYESNECESCFIWFKHGIRDGVVFNELGGHLVMNDLHPDMY